MAQLEVYRVQLGYRSKKNYWDVKYLGEKMGIQVFRINTLQITGIQSTKVMFWMIKIMNVEYSGHRIMGYGILRPLLKGSPDLPLPGETNPDHLINLKIQPLDSYLVDWFQIKYFLHYIPWKCYWVIYLTNSISCPLHIHDVTVAPIYPSRNNKIII